MYCDMQLGGITASREFPLWRRRFGTDPHRSPAGGTTPAGFPRARKIGGCSHMRCYTCMLPMTMVGCLVLFYHRDVVRTPFNACAVQTTTRYYILRMATVLLPFAWLRHPVVWLRWVRLNVRTRRSPLLRLRWPISWWRVWEIVCYANVVSFMESVALADMVVVREGWTAVFWAFSVNRWLA